MENKKCSSHHQPDIYIFPTNIAMENRHFSWAKSTAQKMAAIPMNPRTMVPEGYMATLGTQKRGDFQKESPEKTWCDIDVIEIFIWCDMKFPF